MRALLLVVLAGCGLGTIDSPGDDTVALEQAPGETADDLQSVAQGLESRTPYYRWSSRTDSRAPQFEQCSPALVKLDSYLRTRWGGTNLGCHLERTVANSTTLSTHAWGAALDYNSGSHDTNFGAIADFLIEHSEELGINTIHDYHLVSGQGRMWKPILGWVRADIGGPAEHMHIEVRPDEFADGRSVDEKLAVRVGADGCSRADRQAAAAFGCRCVDGKPNGGWCPGDGCSDSQTHACASFGAGCADGRCRGIFAPGYACTRLEFKNCGTYLSGCIDHRCKGGRVDGTNPQHCTERQLYDCSRFGCGCKDGQCSDGECPLVK